MNISINDFPTYSGNVFRWSGRTGVSDLASLGGDFQYGYVGYSGDFGFVIQSHRTLFKKLFLYVGSVYDDNVNFIGTRWESDDGISVVIREDET